MSQLCDVDTLTTILKEKVWPLKKIAKQVHKTDKKAMNIREIHTSTLPRRQESCSVFFPVDFGF